MPSRSRAPHASAGSILPRAAILALGLTLGSACDRTGDVSEHMRRGDAALAEGRYARALSAYSHAREIAPHDAAVQRAMMRARVHSLADSPARNLPDALEDAQYEAQLLLETDKGREAVYQTALGNILAKQGDAEGAKAKYAEALKSDAASALAHTALGLSLMGRKEGFTQAKVELELALRTRPTHAAALLASGQIKLAEGDLAGAAERLEAALRVGDDFNARMALGTVRVQQQKPAESLDHFQRAAQLEPRSPDALGSLGQSLLSVGKAEEAERALRAASQIRRDEPTDIALGFALLRQKKMDQALGTFSQVLIQDPGAATALFGAANASEGLGKNEQALDLYRRLLTMPAEGAQKQMVADLQKDALGRIKALTPPPAPAASGSAAAGPALGPRR